MGSSDGGRLGSEEAAGVGRYEKPTPKAQRLGAQSLALLRSGRIQKMFATPATSNFRS